MDFKDWLSLDEARLDGGHIVYHASPEANIQNFRIAWRGKARESKGALFVSDNLYDTIVTWANLVLRGTGSAHDEMANRNVTVYKLRIPERLYQLAKSRQDVGIRIWLYPEELGHIEIVGRKTYGVTEIKNWLLSLKNRRHAAGDATVITQRWKPIPGRLGFMAQKLARGRDI